MTEISPLTARYLTALRDHLGWDARPDEDGVVFFERNGVTHRVIPNGPADPEWVDLVIGFRHEAPLTANARLLLERDRTRLFKGVKIRLEETQVEFIIGQLVAGPDRMPTVEHLVAVLPRMTSMLHNAASNVHEAFEEERKLRASLGEEGVA